MILLKSNVIPSELVNALILIDEIFESKVKGPHYDLAMEDKSKSRIVWSNSLHLLGEAHKRQLRNEPI